MKKLLLFLFLLLLPTMVFAKEKTYTLTIPSTTKCDTYESCDLSIRDYLLYQKLSGMELSNGLEIPVTNEMKVYLLEDKYSLYLLEDYDTIKIHIDDKKKEYDSLNYSSLSSFLDSSIYDYYLFGDSISKKDASVRFKKGNDEVYGTLISKNTEKVLVKILVNNNIVSFEYEDDLSIADNASFVKKNDSKGLEYISVVFSDKENRKTLDHSTIFSQGSLLFIVLIFVGLLFLSIFNGKKKK